MASIGFLDQLRPYSELLTTIFSQLNAKSLCSLAQTCRWLSDATQDARSKRKFIASRRNSKQNLHSDGRAKLIFEEADLYSQPFGEKRAATVEDAYATIRNKPGPLPELAPGDVVMRSMYRGTALWVVAWEQFPGELDTINVRGHVGDFSETNEQKLYWLTDEWKQKRQEYLELCEGDIDEAYKAAESLRLICIQSYMEYGYCLPMACWPVVERFTLETYYNYQKVGEGMDIPPPPQGTLNLVPRDFWQYHSHMLIVDPGSIYYKAVESSKPANSSYPFNVKEIVLVYMHPDYYADYTYYDGSDKHKPVVADNFKDRVDHEVVRLMHWVSDGLLAF